MSASSFSQTAFSANSDALVFVARNTSAGNDSSVRMRLGNDTTAAAFDVTMHGSNNATWPSTAVIGTQVSSPLVFVTNTTERLRIASSGAATFAGAVEITGATTLNNDVYQTALKKFYVDSGSNTYFHENSADSFQIVTGGTIAFTLTAGSGLFNGTVIAPAATATKAPLRIPHGTAPTSPTDGDMWTTTAGLFIRINGVTKTVTLT